MFLILLFFILAVPNFTYNSEKNYNSGSQYYCKICDYYCNSCSGLSAHLRSKFHKQNLKSNKSLTDEILNEKDIKPVKLLYCLICNLEFCKRFTYLRHFNSIRHKQTEHQMGLN